MSFQASGQGCPNCGEALSGGQYCSACGQDQSGGPGTLGELASDLGEGLLQLDSRILRTLARILIAPGAATAEYLEGRRQRQARPLRLYIGVSAVVILAMSMLGIVRIDQLLSTADPASLEQIGALLGVTDLQDPVFQRSFDRRFNTLFPLLNAINPLLFAVGLKLVYRRRLYLAHVVFALHFGTFNALLGLAAVLLASLAGALGAFLAFVLTFVYLFLAMRRVYGGTLAQILGRQLLMFLFSTLLTQAFGLVSLFLVAWSVRG